MSLNSQRIGPKQVIGYMLLPGIIPRLRAFGQSGFGWVAYLMAFLYASVRLLPADHPYLRNENVGRYGIRHVIGEAASRLVIKRENIDQIAMFFLLLLGFVLLVLQFVVLVAGLILSPAFAQDPGQGAFEGFFKTPKPENDIALMMLDKIFAIPGLFGSKYDPASGGIPPFNAALHALFEYYSMLMLVVAVLVFLYYIFVVVAETAMTGTPFGRRFSHIYAPIRLVIAVGLLVPVNYGLNSAQYITLFAAKYGSGLATNGWIIFNKAVAEHMSDSEQNQLVARPNVPDVSNLISFMSIVQTCKVAHETIYDQLPVPTGAKSEKPDIKPYLVTLGKKAELAKAGGYKDALKFFDNQDILIVFGHESADLYRAMRGNVMQFCGQVRIHVNDVTQIGAQEVQAGYFNLILQLFEGDVAKPLEEMAKRVVQIHMILDETKKVDPASISVTGDTSGNGGMPAPSFALEMKKKVLELTQNTIYEARDKMLESADEYQFEQELIDRGWSGAAIWYNRIAMWNGAFMGAALNYPTPARMPDVMVRVEAERLAHSPSLDSTNRYAPDLPDDKAVNLEPSNLEIARALNATYQYWSNQNSPLMPIEGKVSGNAFNDMMNMLFGLGGLMEMRDNADIHPFAQMASLGKGIIESSIRNLIVGLAFSFGGGFTEIIEPHVKNGWTSLAGIMMTMTGIGLTVGFVLFYILPFLPFIYFFFALGAWVKTIFEAMVGVPLWALAHLKIDGHGLMGDQALNGYFLIFEIFLRPILTLFGLISSILIFSAMARALNDVFPLVVNNLTGFAYHAEDAGTTEKLAIDFRRGAIDEFFFTIIYAIIVYIMGTSCFKMIDRIPAEILRWMGAGAKPFSDNHQDATESLVQYAAIGGSSMSGQVTGALSSVSRVVGQGAALPIDAARRVVGRNRAEAGGGASGGGD